MPLMLGGYLHRKIYQSNYTRTITAAVITTVSHQDNFTVKFLSRYKLRVNHSKAFI